MVEPFSLAVNVIQIISACASTIQTIDHLIQQYADASAKLKSLSAKANLVKVTLNELDRLLRGRDSFFAQKIEDDPDLRSAIDQTLTGCWTVFLLLQKELKKWMPDTDREANFRQRAGLLFNDEIIQDYRIQIEGHVEGLKTVLVCLQAKTVAETHQTLQQANATLEKIANATLNIRQTHKEICFPESVYEGYTTFEEDKGFDKELLNTPAYRAAFQMARKNSNMGGDASVTGGSLSTAARQQARKDFLSDQVLEERSLTLTEGHDPLDVFNEEAIEDLIKLDDDEVLWNGQPSASPNNDLMELAGLTWPPKPHLLDDGLAEVVANATVQPLRASSQRIASSPPLAAESATVELESMLDDLLKESTVSPVRHLVDEREERRDSGQAQIEQKQVVHEHSGLGSPILLEEKGSLVDLPEHRQSIPEIVHPTDEKFAITETEGLIPYAGKQDEEKILASTEPANGRHLSTTSMGRTASMSTASTIPISSPISGDFSPISPSGSLAGNTLPKDHRFSNPPEYVPQADEHTEQHLLTTMHPSLQSQNSEAQLNWAEDTMRHLAMNAAHEKRLVELKMLSALSEAPESSNETILRTESTRIVEDLRRAEHGRAYFLSARYLAEGEEQEHLYLLATSKGFHRSQYYLGKRAEQRGVAGDALTRYRAGGVHSDSACLHRLAQAHFNGQLGIKRNKEEGLRILRSAANHADKDYPDALHHLATLYLPQTASKFKTVSSSKPLLPKNVIEATTLLRKAALLGHGPSQLRLGQVHRCGYFDPKDMKKAEKPASKLSRTTSVFNRRSSSISTGSSGGGNDAQVDATLALHYLHLASRRGLAEADYEIAHDLLFNAGELSKEHRKFAYIHTHRAYAAGVPRAYGLMGKVLEEGIGCKVNKTKAEDLYFKGGTMGDSWARSRSDELRNQNFGVQGTQATWVRPETPKSKK